MKTFRQALLLVVIILCSAAVSRALEFSADTESLVNGRPIHGKFYSKTDRQRIEAEADGKRQISIIRMDKKLAWHIADQQKQYLELPLSNNDMLGFAVMTVPGEVKRDTMGKETVHGRSTVKYRVYCKIENREGFFYQWVDEEYRIPVKIADKDGKYVSEFRNIKIGPQQNDLFELPADYTRYMMVPNTK